LKEDTDDDDVPTLPQTMAVHRKETVTREEVPTTNELPEVQHERKDQLKKMGWKLRQCPKCGMMKNLGEYATRCYRCARKAEKKRDALETAQSWEEER